MGQIAARRRGRRLRSDHFSGGAGKFNFGKGPLLMRGSLKKGRGRESNRDSGATFDRDRVPSAGGIGHTGGAVGVVLASGCGDWGKRARSASGSRLRLLGWLICSSPASPAPTWEAVHARVAIALASRRFIARSGRRRGLTLNADRGAQHRDEREQDSALHNLHPARLSRPRAPSLSNTKARGKRKSVPDGKARTRASSRRTLRCLVFVPLG